MGLSFSSLCDDASTLFINPAGLVTTRGIALYGDYTNGADPCSKGYVRGCLALPYERLTVAAGFFRDNMDGGGTWNVLVAGAAWRMTEGAQGSFLSIGADARFGRIAQDVIGSCDVCGPARTADTGLTAGIGIMVRPLPIVSIGCSSENLFEKRFELGSAGVTWKRHTRLGISWFLQGRAVISWEREYYGAREINHYGISVRTSVPIELMTGFYEGKVTGGIRWVHRRFDVSIAFSPEDEGRIATSVCAQLFFRKKPDEIHQ